MLPALRRRAARRSLPRSLRPAAGAVGMAYLLTSLPVFTSQMRRLRSPRMQPLTACFARRAKTPRPAPLPPRALEAGEPQRRSPVPQPHGFVFRPAGEQQLAVARHVQPEIVAPRGPR